MNGAKLFLVIALFAAAISARAQAAVEGSVLEKPTNFVVCKNRKIVRTIRVEKDPKDNKCVTKYTKAGVDAEVGRGLNRFSCAKVLGNIKENLEKANWKCKEVSNYSSTSSDELSSETKK